MKKLSTGLALLLVLGLALAPPAMADKRDGYRGDRGHRVEHRRDHRREHRGAYREGRGDYRGSHFRPGRDYRHERRVHKREHRRWHRQDHRRWHRQKHRRDHWYGYRPPRHRHHHRPPYYRPYYQPWFGLLGVPRHYPGYYDGDLAISVWLDGLGFSYYERGY